MFSDECVRLGMIYVSGYVCLATNMCVGDVMCQDVMLYIGICVLGEEVLQWPPGICEFRTERGLGLAIQQPLPNKYHEHALLRSQCL